MVLCDINKLAMSTTNKLIIAGLVVGVCLLITDIFYFSNLPQNLLTVPFLTKPSLTPTPSPLLTSTPTDRIVWHDMSDIKFTGLDLNKLNQSLVESWLASSSGVIDYNDSSASASVKLVPGKYKRYTNNAIFIIQGQKEVQIGIPSDSSARLWKKTPQNLFVASPSLDQIIKYNLVSFGLKPGDLVVVYEVSGVNVTVKSKGIWLIVFSQI